ncbi:ABC transporter substrate-binding protein [Aeromicrobium sp. CTD01-1L150]|uniref:ABC transporter substrate-binding protein n=1 Tax=Aeromicrobium sp. CTD01-1L150 TaxID=3341830 RepID=UPI0035C058B5
MSSLVAATVTASLASCALGASGDGVCDEASSVTIAYQPGLGYANLLLVQANEDLEEALPDIDITWRELNSGAAIRDGTLAGEIQVAAGGAGPFIIGRGAGMQWKMISALNSMNLQLMTMDPGIRSLEQLQGDGSIAMPGPDSIQSIVLRKAAQDELGDPRALDSQIIAMGHPDGMQALIAGQLDAHLTAPPFQQQEAGQGAHALVDSYDVFDGPHTFNGVYAMEDFVECNPDVAPALIEALEAANEEIATDPDSAAGKLTGAIGDMDAAEISAELTTEGTEFTTGPIGLGLFASFMEETGLIRERLTTEDLFFENDATEGGT